MSRLLMSLPIVRPTSFEPRIEHQGQFRLGHIPLRIAADPQRLVRPGDAMRRGFEKQFRPLGGIDAIVERRGRLLILPSVPSCCACRSRPRPKPLADRSAATAKRRSSGIGFAVRISQPSGMRGAGSSASRISRERIRCRASSDRVHERRDRIPFDDADAEVSIRKCEILRVARRVVPSARILATNMPRRAKPQTSRKPLASVLGPSCLPHLTCDQRQFLQRVVGLAGDADQRDAAAAEASAMAPLRPPYQSLRVGSCAGSNRCLEFA